MNKTITIYELLGLVKDGKAPKKIKYDGYLWSYCNIYCHNGVYCSYWNEMDIELQDYTENNIIRYLNDTVEIIEDNDKLENKKMFKLNKFVPSQEYIMTDKNVDLDNKIEMIRKRFYSNELYMLDIVDKINEIIDHINKIEEKLDER